MLKKHSVNAENYIEDITVPKSMFFFSVMIIVYGSRSFLTDSF